jgi:hypothetical protein
MTAAAVSIYAARVARSQAREAAEASPYEALSARVVNLEHQVEALTTQLHNQRQESARRESRFRARIDMLLVHIDKLTAYAELLLDVVRRDRVEMVQLPDMPHLPPEARVEDFD